MVFSALLRSSDGLPAHVAEDLLLQLGLNSAGREQKTDIRFDSRSTGLCHLHHNVPGQMRGRGGGSSLQQSEKHLQATMYCIFYPTCVLQFLTFSVVYRSWTSCAKGRCSQEPSAGLKLVLAGCGFFSPKFVLIRLFFFVLNTSNHHLLLVECRWFLFWQTNWLSFLGSAPLFLGALTKSRWGKKKHCFSSLNLKT